MVVVDDDVDVTSDFDVLWAMATRMQADADMDIMRNAMGAILDPSNRQGTTAKLIVDATRKTTPFPKRHTIPKQALERAEAVLVCDCAQALMAFPQRGARGCACSSAQPEALIARASDMQ